MLTANFVRAVAIGWGMAFQSDEAQRHFPSIDGLMPEEQLL
jgi:hypothetical protein